MNHHASAPDNNDAHDYAKRIHEWMPRRLQELREAIGLSNYAVSRGIPSAASR
jgi:hypothetical protein